MFVDSHCHLIYDDLKTQIPLILENAKQANVGYMLNIATKPEEFEANLELIRDYDHIFQAVGTHPHYAQDDHEVSAEKLAAFVNQSEKIIAIGETGLDFYYEYSPKEQQEFQFCRHINAAKIANLPVIVHTREAEEETIRILQEEYKKSPFSFVLHCFSGTQKLADACLELGGYLSFSGIMTFNKAQEIRNVAYKAPVDRILIETDAPYLAPVPHRGKTNEPSYVIHTAKCLAEVKSQSLEDIAQQTTENFFRLFSKAKRAK